MERYQSGNIIPLRPPAIPRNGISLLNVAVNDIHKFSIEHSMKLNPKKCKEMLINFMRNYIILLQDQLSLVVTQLNV